MAEQQKIICKLVIEVLGKPEQHVTDTLKLLLKKMRDEEEGVKILNGKVHKPKKEGDFFSSFAEIDAELADFALLSGICFNYMPSSIEIIEPEKLDLKALKISDFINDLMAKLHDVDMRLKSITSQNIVLDKNCFSLLKNIVTIVLSQSPRTMKELEKDTGIPEKQLQIFAKKFIEEGLITKKGEKYSIK